MVNIFTRFRTEAEARDAIGKQVVCDGDKWQCVGHNDLGCLYWSKVKRGKVQALQYTGKAMDREFEKCKNLIGYHP